VGKSKATPLLLASYAGHCSVVQILLQYGTNPDVAVKGWSEEYEEAAQCSTALQAAALGGHESVVRLLLDHPVFDENRRRGEGRVLDVNANEADSANCDVFYSPPQSAPSHDSDSADSDDDDSTDRLDGTAINVKKGDYGTALQAACFEGNEVIVRMLLDKGADANIKGGHFGTALQAASFRGLKRLYDCYSRGGQMPILNHACMERHCRWQHLEDV
jgi:ankyrin repeat protein